MPDQENTEQYRPSVITFKLTNFVLGVSGLQRQKLYRHRGMNLSYSSNLELRTLICLTAGISKEERREAK